MQNPFGVSPMWVAESEGRVVGFRTFLRWELVHPDGATLRAVRAVDTATDPDFQGRGIFTRLTLEAVEELTAEGVDLVFNTPNEKSRPGYLKMGWREVGRLPVGLRPASWRFPFLIATARTSAGRHPVPTGAGVAPLDALADRAAVERLLDSDASRPGLATRRTFEFLSWRYGNPALGYRVALADSSIDEGCVAFRLRRRGRAVEAVICDLLLPGRRQDAARKLLRQVSGKTRADYLLRLDTPAAVGGRFVRVGSMGPTLVCRPLAGDRDLLDPRAWALDMGDVELF